MTSSSTALSRRRLPLPGRIPVERVVASVPRPGSRAVDSSGGGPVGRTEDGAIRVEDRVVSRISSRAAGEVEGVGSAAHRLLGVKVEAPGMDRLGRRTTSLSALPTVQAEVDGRRVFVRVTMSVAYPNPLQRTAQQVRDRITERLSSLTGLEVAEVDVSVTALVTEAEPPARVL